jgi:hypothetical protein
MEAQTRMTKPIRYPVTERALIQRLNRNLSHEHLRVKKTREGRSSLDLGDYYILDIHRNAIAEHHLSLPDLVDMAKERKILRAFENLVTE